MFDINKSNGYTIDRRQIASMKIKKRRVNYYGY